MVAYNLLVNLWVSCSAVWAQDTDDEIFKNWLGFGKNDSRPEWISEDEWPSRDEPPLEQSNAVEVPAPNPPTEQPASVTHETLQPESPQESSDEPSTVSYSKDDSTEVLSARTENTPLIIGCVLGVVMTLLIFSAVFCIKPRGEYSLVFSDQAENNREIAEMHV